MKNIIFCLLFLFLQLPLMSDAKIATSDFRSGQTDNEKCWRWENMMTGDLEEALKKNGFKACVIVTGHGATEYIRILKNLERQAMEGPMKVIFSNLISIERPAETLYPGSGGHADFAEASNLTAVDPNMVNKGKFGKSERDRKVGIDRKNVGLIDQKKGAIYLNWRADRIIRTVNQFLEDLD